MEHERSGNAAFDAPPPYSGVNQTQPPQPTGYQQNYGAGGYPATTYPQSSYPPGTYPLQVGGPQPVLTSTGVIATTQPVYAYQPQQGIVVGNPSNHAGLAWFSCLCCFWPLGLVAIIKSREVDQAFNRGDLNGANVSSRSARQFSMIAICIGVTSYVIAFIFVILFSTVIASSRSRWD